MSGRGLGLQRARRRIVARVGRKPTKNSRAWDSGSDECQKTKEGRDLAHCAAGPKVGPVGGHLENLDGHQSRDRIKRGCWEFLDFPALPLARGDVSMQAIFFCPQGQATP